MTSNKIIFALAMGLAAVGCKDKDGSDTGGTTTAGTTGGTTGGSSFGAGDVSLSLTSGGIALTISNAPAGFDFGINENCGDPGNCWEAESCLTDTAGYAFCHDAGTTGVSLAKVAGPDDVVSSSTTLFDDSFAGTLGYMLDDGSTCYAWGDYKSYFVDGAGCTAW